MSAVAVKLKGRRLADEIDRARADSAWTRLKDLLPSVQSKGSGVEFMAHFLLAEHRLETFILENGNGAELPKVSETNAALLGDAKSSFECAIAGTSSNVGVGPKEAVQFEAHLLLAKLHYLCGQYPQAIEAVAKSEKKETQYQSLRTLKLVAEAYAIKGLALERKSAGKLVDSPARQELDRQVLNCFEKAAELSLAYIQEVEKSTNQPTAPTGYFTSFSTPAAAVPSNVSSAGALTSSVSSAGLFALSPSGKPLPFERISELMETAIQRVPLMRIRLSSCAAGGPSTSARGSNSNSVVGGVEEYRKMLTAIGDKPIASQLQQKLSRQLAEVLLRGVAEATYWSPKQTRRKSYGAGGAPSFFVGTVGNTQSYCPEGRLEEALLILSLSEALAAREAVLSRAEEDSAAREESLANVKAVHNLLTLVLSSLRQYQLLAGLLEKAMKFAYEDRFIWTQFALSLTCSGHQSRAANVLEQTLRDARSRRDIADDDGDEELSLTLLAAKISIEQLGLYDQGIEYAEKAAELCGEAGWLRGRSQLLLGLAYSLKAETRSSQLEREGLQKGALEALEGACRADPKDHLPRFYLALQNAIVGDLWTARENCQKSMELCADFPLSYLLLALILTAEQQHNDALAVVEQALAEYPHNYPLLVLRLKLQSQLSHPVESLETALQLLLFWKNNEGADDTHIHVVPVVTILERRGSVKTATVGVGSLAPPAPVQNAASTPLMHTVPSMSTFDVIGADRESVYGHSEVGGGGGGGTTLLNGGGGGSVASRVGALSCAGSMVERRFKVLADVWLELSDLFFKGHRMAAVHRCVEETAAAFPDSHQAVYLKGRVLLAQMAQTSTAATSGGESRKLLDEAKTCFLSALSFQPSHAPSLRQLAAVYKIEGNLRMAEKILMDLVKAEPRDHDAWLMLGRAVAEQGGRYEQAGACFELALDLAETAPIMPFSLVPRLLCR